MSYSAYQSPYGTYQPSTPYANIPYQTGHYQSQYPQTTVPVPSTTSFVPYQPPPKSSPPPDLPPPPPDLTSVTPRVATDAIQKLVSFELKDAGFSTAQPLAMQRLEFEVVSFIEMLYERAHEYANLANRAGPITTDLMLACQDFRLQPKELHRVSPNSSKNKKRVYGAPALIPPPSRSPSPELLPSDDEEVPPVIPATLRTLPSYFPSLPPKHTYLRTPASPPKKAALPSLEKKLKTAGLVQDSLKNLLLATEDSSGQEDGELLGHIVNWEAGIHPRKRWKLGQ
jgi:transcription initiation factor TFIID subunit 8